MNKKIWKITANKETELPALHIVADSLDNALELARTFDSRYNCGYVIIKTVKLEKEGDYYTLYINNTIMGCGYLEDMINDLDEYIDEYKELSM